MPDEYLPLYTGSRAEATRYGELDDWDRSFRENVCCARAIEKAVRDYAGEDHNITPGCAQAVLDEYGFKRTGFVLAHTVRNLGPLVKPSPEADAWSWQFDHFRDKDFGRYFEAQLSLADIDAFIGQYQEAYQTLGLLGKEHCDPEKWQESLDGKVLLLSPNVLREKYWSVENMLWLCTGGFGASPNARGRAVYAICLSDGEETRWNRGDFVGVLDEKYLPEWATEKVEALRTPQQEQSDSPVMG